MKILLITISLLLIIVSCTAQEPIVQPCNCTNVTEPFAPEHNCSLLHNLSNESPLYFADWQNTSYILALEPEDIWCVYPVGSQNVTICRTSVETWSTYCEMPS